MAALAALTVVCWGAGAGDALADSAREKRATVKTAAISPEKKHAQEGIASIYTCSRTASGERYCPEAMAAAHRTLPMGTKLKVTHAGTGRSVVVRVNDRGPFKKGRIVDLTPAAAKSIGLTWKHGITKVEVSVVDG